MSTRRSTRISKKSQTSNKKSTSGPIEKYLVAAGSSKRKQSWLTPPDQEEQMLTSQAPKRQQLQIQNQWQPITACQPISTRTLVPSASPSTQVPCREAMLEAGGSCYTFKNIFTCTSNRCPLPPLKWANPEEVWSVMRAKEKRYIRDKNLFIKHPQLQCRMRAILLDWIIEVCEVYRLHRETFYLATEFIDRYLSTKHDVAKYQLQLIGVTSLFMAAKLEEIYPPKIGEFAYVTDGACTEEDIKTQELIILKTLQWNLNPMTVNSWMTLYLNILNYIPDGSCITELKFSGCAFLVIARLMDLCTLDEGSLQFSTSILAAAILYHFADETQATAASGYSFVELEQCINWVAPFAITTREQVHQVTRKSFDDIHLDDQHNIQTHDADIALLDKAKLRQQLMALPVSRASPELSDCIAPDMLTPPPTSHKHSAASLSPEALGVINEEVVSTSRGHSSCSQSSSQSAFSIADDIVNSLLHADEVISCDEEDDIPQC
ncbi:G1/S-specific cyclin-E-like [Watersipora subatra]|uniref:G1/S-specific cyclin-E-like n=1 Tax=Watersipora subatra TaxID=2589382 RepID=UPI00355BFDC8